MLQITPPSRRRFLSLRLQALESRQPLASDGGTALYGPLLWQPVDSSSPESPAAEVAPALTCSVPARSPVAPVASVAEGEGSEGSEGSEGVGLGLPPVTVRDAVHVLEQIPFEIPVLANDLDPEGGKLTLRSVTSPEHGTAVTRPDGVVVYVSHAGYEGIDRFQYEVVDAEGLVATGAVDIAVLNANPVVRSLAWPAVAVPGQPLNFAATFFDSGTTDTHQAQWNWGDGRVQDAGVSESAGIGNALGATSYSTPGARTVTLRVEDDSFGRDTVSRTIDVQQVAVGEAFGRNRVLLVGGTPGDDRIHVQLVSNQWLRVQLNRVEIARVELRSVASLAIFGAEGNDTITLERVPIPAILDGGFGDDYLRGALAADVLLGGPGDDSLWGGAGRNFLIGGLGADTLNGGAGDELMVAGTTSFDQHFAALLSLLDEWSDPAANYDARLSQLRQGDGAHPAWALNAITVQADGAKNMLRGGEGRDWYFARPSIGAARLDSILGRTLAETLSWL